MSLVDGLIAHALRRDLSGLPAEYNLIVSLNDLRALVSAALEVRGDASLDCSAHQTPSYGCPTCYPVIPSAAGDAAPVAWQYRTHDPIDDGWSQWSDVRQCDLVTMRSWVAGDPENRELRPLYTAAPAKGDTPSVVRDALRRAEQALNDWMNLYADDQCGAEAYYATVERVNERGTLAYISGALGAVRAALAPAGEPNGQKT